MPVNLNYWHVQLTITVGDAIANDNTTAIGRNLSKYIIDHLITPFGRREIGTYDSISKDLYLKNMSNTK